MNFFKGRPSEALITEAQIIYFFPPYSHLHLCWLWSSGRSLCPSKDQRKNISNWKPLFEKRIKVYKGQLKGEAVIPSVPLEP